MGILYGIAGGSVERLFIVWIEAGDHVDQHFLAGCEFRLKYSEFTQLAHFRDGMAVAIRAYEPELDGDLIGLFQLFCI